MLLQNLPEGVSLEQVDRATALVASALGTTTLEQRTVSESGTVGQHGIIALKDGPCTGLNALTLNGAPAAGILSTPWTVDVSALVGPRRSEFWTSSYGLSYDSVAYGRTSTPYTVSYTAGFTADTLPPQLKEAILISAGALARAALLGGVKTEVMGPVTRTYFDLADGTVNPQLDTLLRAWKPLLV